MNRADALDAEYDEYEYQVSKKKLLLLTSVLLPVAWYVARQMKKK